MEINNIDYDLERMHDLSYVLSKMNEYLNKIGFEKAVRSQKFIRHLHILVALKLKNDLKIPPDNIHFELKLRNKNIDVGVIEDGKIKVAISIKSQTGSIKKNFTNTINNLQGEVVGLKSLYPNLKAGLVYLFKQIDVSNQDNCLEYYKNNIPKKLLPIISIGQKDSFDTACIIIWETENNNLKLIENDIIKPYSIDNFINEIGFLYQEDNLKSAFTLNNLDNDKFIDFLKPS